MERFCSDIAFCFPYSCNDADSAFRTFILSQMGNIECFEALSKAITEIVKNSEKKLILMLDMVDEVLVDDMFTKFITLLYDKHIAAQKGEGITFHSVILSGFYDISYVKELINHETDKKPYQTWYVSLMGDE